MRILNIIVPTVWTQGAVPCRKVVVTLGGVREGPGSLTSTIYIKICRTPHGNESARPDYQIIFQGKCWDKWMKADFMNINTACWMCLVFSQRHHQDLENANYNDTNMEGGGSLIKGWQKSGSAAVLLLSATFTVIHFMVLDNTHFTKPLLATVRSGRFGIWRV